MMNSQNFHHDRSRFSWWMVKIFIMTDQDFHDEWSRFSSWLVQIFIMTGPDFHPERSRIAYCFGYNPKVQGEHLAVQLLWGATWLLVTCVSLIYLVMSSSFCSWSSWIKWGGWVNLRFYLFVLGANQRNDRGRWVNKDFLVLL